jgi:hypothetical protein
MTWEQREEFRNTAIARRNKRGIGPIYGKLRAYDYDERYWEGFVNGQLAYIVHRGSWSHYESNDCDSCESELDGINICEAHALYGNSWPTSRRFDPLLSQAP